MSSSHERRVVSYLRPKNHNIFKAYAKAEEMNDSEAVNHIINNFFARLSPEQKQSYLAKAANINKFR